MAHVNAGINPLPDSTGYMTPDTVGVTSSPADGSVRMPTHLP